MADGTNPARRSAGAAEPGPGPGSPAADCAGVPTVGVLGEVTASSGGVPLDLGGPRQRAVLARLVLGRGAMVSTDQLVEALWGEQPPAAATASLHTYISHLRRRLQPDRPGRARDGLITRVADGYLLALPLDAVDSWRFEQLLRDAATVAERDPSEAAQRLQQALSLWRGPAYSGYRDQPWAEAEVARLTELRAVASEQLLAARLSGGESALLVPELEVLVAEEPLREERWRLLVLALYRSGRQADALAALRRARSTLAEELGVDPGPALRALETEVLAQSPALDPAVAVSPEPAAASGAAGPSAAEGSLAAPVPAGARSSTAVVETGRPRSVRSRDVLVERERELADLDSCLGDALDGQGRLALVSGPAGIGKSRLLAEVRRLAEETGARLLTARCSELEREFGFGAVRQLFEPTLADPHRRTEMLRGSAVAAGPVFDPLASLPPSAGAEESSFATLHGLYWLTVNLVADGPLILAVDDLHWCDSGSLRFLTYLVRRLEGLPVLIVGTLRTGEEFPDAQLLEELRLDLSTVPIRPGPLTPVGLRRIVAERLGPDPDETFCAACYATTGGNPLLLRQLLRALESEGVRPDGSHADTARALGSRAIGSMVLLRLGRLPAAATAVARAIAVLGDGAALPVVATLSGLDESVAATATAALARSEVLRPESPLAFVHPLVRQAVYGDIPLGERELLHDRAGRLLERSGAPVEQVAAQLLAAPRRADGWAVDVLHRAAAEALRRGAPDGAISFLRRALAEPAPAELRPDLLLELARAESSTDGPAALADLEEAYATLTDPDRRASAAIVLARTMVFVAPQGRAAAFARATRTALDDRHRDEQQGLFALERISVHMHGLDAREWQLAGAGFDEPVIEGEGPGARMLSAQLAWDRMCAVQHRSAVIEAASAALSDGTLYSVDNGLLWVVAIMVQDLAEVDVMPLWENALAQAHQRGSLFSVLSVSLWRGYSLRRRGDLPEAEESLLAALDQLEMWQEPGIGAPYAQAELVRVLVDQDRLDEAKSRLAAFPPAAPGTDGERLRLEAEAEVRLLDRQWDEAADLLARANEMLPHLRNPAWRRGPSLLALVLAGSGRSGEALDLLAEQIELARRWGAPWVLGRLLRLSGTIRHELDPDAGVAELVEAEQVLVRSVARLEHAKALVALGRALLRSAPGERSRAVTYLLRADEIAESCSAVRLHREAVDALAEAGVQAPEQRRSGLATLTSTQRRIAVLAADGVEPRSIAEGLYLTPRAVERHLAEVRRRLGIGPDVDLAASLAAAAQAAGYALTGLHQHS